MIRFEKTKVGSREVRTVSGVTGDGRSIRRYFFARDIFALFYPAQINACSAKVRAVAGEHAFTKTVPINEEGHLAFTLLLDDIGCIQLTTHLKDVNPDMRKLVCDAFFSAGSILEKEKHRGMDDDRMPTIEPVQEDDDEMTIQIEVKIKNFREKVKKLLDILS